MMPGDGDIFFIRLPPLVPVLLYIKLHAPDIDYLIILDDFMALIGLVELEYYSPLRIIELLAQDKLFNEQCGDLLRRGIPERALFLLVGNPEISIAGLIVQGKRPFLAFPVKSLQAPVQHLEPVPGLRQRLFLAGIVLQDAKGCQRLVNVIRAAILAFLQEVAQDDPFFFNRLGAGLGTEKVQYVLGFFQAKAQVKYCAESFHLVRMGLEPAFYKIQNRAILLRPLLISQGIEKIDVNFSFP
jgi:hypothetical protein